MAGRQDPFHIWESLTRTLNLQETKHRGQKSEDRYGRRHHDSGGDAIFLLRPMWKRGGVGEVVRLFAHLRRERCDFLRFRQWLRLSRCDRVETSFDFAKANSIAHPQKRIGSHLAVHTCAVGRAEISDLVTSFDQEQLRVPTGDRGVVNLQEVFGSAPDRDFLLRQLVRGPARWQKNGQFRHGNTRYQIQPGRAIASAPPPRQLVIFLENRPAVPGLAGWLGRVFERTLQIYFRQVIGRIKFEESREQNLRASEIALPEFLEPFLLDFEVVEQFGIDRVVL